MCQAVFTHFTASRETRASTHTSQRGCSDSASTGPARGPGAAERPHKGDNCPSASHVSSSPTEVTESGSPGIISKVSGPISTKLSWQRSIRKVRVEEYRNQKGAQRLPVLLGHESSLSRHLVLTEVDRWALKAHCPITSNSIERDGTFWNRLGLRTNTPGLCALFLGDGLRSSLWNHSSSSSSTGSVKPSKVTLVLRFQCQSWLKAHSYGRRLLLVSSQMEDHEPMFLNTELNSLHMWLIPHVSTRTHFYPSFPSFRKGTVKMI